MSKATPDHSTLSKSLDILHIHQSTSEIYGLLCAIISANAAITKDAWVNGLMTLDIDKNDLVAIHDCARSFLPDDLLEALIIEAKKYGSCSPVMKTKLISKSSNEIANEKIMEILPTLADF